MGTLLMVLDPVLSKRWSNAFGHLSILALLGGIVGVLAGIVATAIYASTKGWAVVIPPLAWAGGLAAAIAIGAIAGLLPAIRALRTV